MSISTELAGTEQNLTIYTSNDLLLSGTIKDQDGKAVDLTGTTQKMLFKHDKDAADADADGEATIAVVTAGEGTITIDLDDASLEPDKTHHHSLKVLFPADYATERLRNKQLTAMWGTIKVMRQATRAVA